MNKYYRENIITEIHECSYIKCKGEKKRVNKIHRVLNKNAYETHLICLGCNNESTLMSQKWVKENLF
tara:strand:+ start:67 stop:267 length:201 start_codon:yes stop_codon:yes gene_type:complete